MSDRGAPLTQEELERVWPVGTQVLDCEGDVWEFDGTHWYTEIDSEPGLETGLEMLQFLNTFWGPLSWPEGT